MQQLGPAREWDAFAGTTVARLVTAAPGVDLGVLREAVERKRKSSHGALQIVLADLRCSRFLLSLGNLVERRSWRNEIDSEALIVLSQPMPMLADKILARLHRKALKRGAHFRQLNVGRNTISESTSRSCAMRRSSSCRFISPMRPRGAT